jgi:hypothetical protein
LLAAANKKLEDQPDIGFAEDMKDLPMFREGGGAPEEEAKEGENANKGRYTVAFKKMDEDRGLKEPLLSSSEGDQKHD